MATDFLSTPFAKWQQREAAAKAVGVSPSMLTKVKREDLRKAVSGRSTLSDNEALATIASLSTGKGLIQKKPKTGNKPWDILGNAVGDIGEMVTGLTAIPKYLWNMPEYATDFGLIMSGRDDVMNKYGIEDVNDFGDVLRNVNRVPLMNLIPGVSTAANLTTAEGRQNIMENPLHTALDVAPAGRILSRGAVAAAKPGMMTAIKAETKAAKSAQTATRATLSKLEAGKRLNWKDLETLPNRGLQEVIRHAEDVTTPIKVGSRDYSRAQQLLNKRQSGSAIEPNFMPTRTIRRAVEQIIDDPNWSDPIAVFDDALNAAGKTPAAGAKAVEAATRHVEGVLPKGAGSQKVISPDVIAYGVRGPNDELLGYARIQGMDAGTPNIELIHTTPAGKGQGVAQQILRDIEGSGLDIKELIKNSEFTPQGRKLFERYLDTKRTPAPKITQTVEQVTTKPVDLFAKGGALEALAMGRPLKAAVRGAPAIPGTGGLKITSTDPFNPGVVQKTARVIGTSSELKKLYAAFGGKIPRQFEHKLMNSVDNVAKELDEIRTKLPKEQQLSFYEDLMAAARQSADTIRDSTLSPEMKAAVNVLRDDIQKQLQGTLADNVVPVNYNGKVELYSRSSPVARAFQRFEKSMQNKPKDWSKDSPIEQHTRWTNSHKAAQAELKEALDTNAPLRFHHLVENKLANDLAIKLMADENNVIRAERANNTIDLIRTGKVPSVDDLKTLSTDTLNRVMEDFPKGKGTTNTRALAKVKAELQDRAANGRVGPQDIMSQSMMHELAQKIKNGDYLQYMSEAQYLEMVDDATKFWQDLKADGYDPVPVPYVRKAHQHTKDTYIQPIPEGVSPTDVDRFRDAVFDFTPHQNDISVALSTEAVTKLRNDATKMFHEEYVGKLAEDAESVTRRFADEFPDLDRRQLEDAIKAKYVAYDPQAARPFEAKWDLSVRDTGAMLLPKYVERQVRKLVPRDRMPIKGAYDTINKVFRFSVLTSPRHVVHIAGGGMTQMLLRDPMALKDVIAGLRMARHNGREMPIDLAKGIDGFKTEEIFGLASGRSLGRLYDEGKKAHGLFRTMEEFLANSLKSADYIYNNKKALKKGMSDEFAHNAGIEAAHKALAIFEDMSPFERQWIRTAIPFYGFTRHLTRYLLSYPADHPYKAAILPQMMRIEYADQEGGLPRIWNQLFFWGKPNGEGDEWGRDIKALNPFRTAFNNFTLAGILSQTSPFIQYPMEFFGVNPQSGSAELYPELSYDPATGGLKRKREDAIPKLIESFIPQAEVLDTYLGLSSEAKRIMRDGDPNHVARQKVMTALGIPFEKKERNLGTEWAKIQGNLLEDASEAVAKGLGGESTKGIREYNLVPFNGQLLPGDQVADYIDQLKQLVRQNPQLEALGVTPKTMNRMIR